MLSRRVKIIRIRIKENGEKKLNLYLPYFLVSIIIFFIPRRLIQEWVTDEVDLKGILQTIGSQGKGLEIRVEDKDDLVLVKFT